jgi:hypothetical protein
MMLALVTQVVVAVIAGEPAVVEAPADAADPRWFVARPVAADYDNTAGDAVIRYEHVALPALDGQRRVDVAAVPALAGLGTHRLGVGGEVRFAIVVRRDDSYVGYLTELIGVPFVLGPRRAGGVHQTDARIGADCVALVIYGRRRLGERVAYMAPRALARRLIPVRRARAGDVLHFTWQTAVLYEDRGARGVVDADDLIIHTFHGVAEIARLGDVPYGRAQHRVLRWPG